MTSGEESEGFDKSKVTDLVATVLIAGMGLFIAYVCFGILNSHADAKMKGYSLEGAIAGALVSSSLLFSAYHQFQKSSGELEKLQKTNAESVEKLTARIQELQQKVIRGAPCPTGFETEIDEREKIVLARPCDWQPRGGILFDFEQPAAKAKDEIFPATFKVTFVPITSDGPATTTVPATTVVPADDIDSGKKIRDADAFYEDYVKGIESAPDAGHTAEYIYLGGEPRSIKSLKVIGHQYAAVRTVTDPTGKTTHDWQLWTPPATGAGPPTVETGPAASAGDKPGPESTGKDGTKSPGPASPAAPPQRDQAVSRPSDEPKPPVQTKPAAESEQANPDELPRTRIVRVCHMHVVCYHQELKKIFYFNFYDDEAGFANSSEKFNQILDSARFLT